LVPLAAYALEMIALRHLDQGVFGVWMAVEPALGGLIGALLLGQRLALWQLPGFALVVTAGIGAQRAQPR
jgi:inner membrane transporter RhtA